ncbi:MAG: cadherin repeat domain-containing protein, partial [Gammaproteobacteria bacterium]|nr:cadherin repeat domain-containing protein [Gammaproteobacteria bacterium]
MMPLYTTNVCSAADIIWVEDFLPSGAGGESEEGAVWNWVSAEPTPFSGALACKSGIQEGVHQYVFMNATDTLAINEGDTLIAYAYLNPINPPSTVMLQWYDGTWQHRAYWGANTLTEGENGTDSRRPMGALPPLGVWVRLEVPASIIGLEGSILSGMAFTLYDGSATWDSTGKSVLAGAPVLDPIADITVAAGETVILNPSATDQDGDMITFSYAGWMTSGTYTTSYFDAGIHTVTVTVSDGILTDTQDVTITVTDVSAGTALDTTADDSVGGGSADSNWSPYLSGDIIV